MTSRRPNGRLSIGRLSIAALPLAAVLAVGLGIATARAEEGVPAPHPALAERTKQGRPLPWVFPLFQHGSLSRVDTESRSLLETLLRHARPGTQVRIASQRWDRYWNRGAERPLASFPLDRFSGPDCWAPLADAVRRGVDVAVVQNGRGAVPQVVSWLRNPTAAAECPVSLGPGAGEIRVKVCSRPPDGPGGGCLGDGSMNASFVTFEHVDLGGVDLHDVVAITGARFDNRHLHEQNDWIVVVGDRALASALDAYFDAMFDAPDEAPAAEWKGIPDGDSFRHDAAGDATSAASVAAGAGSAVSIALHPRSDFVQLEALQQVECDPTARIRVLMAPPTKGPGGSALIDALRRLGRAGCQVEALMRERTIEESEALVAQLAADKVSIVAVPRISSAFFNSRFVLIDAKLGGKRRRLVYTGGASFDPDAAGRNEEILVAIEDDDVFRAYEAQVDHLCTRLNCRIAPAD